MRRLIGCICLILLLAAPISFEYTGQRQVFNLFQQTELEEGVLYNPEDDISIFHAIGNIFYGTFNEPVESIIFITWNGTVCLYTSQLSHRVYAPLGIVGKDLRTKGQDLTDVILVVHNHFACPIFSPRDIRYYYHLRRNGFTGVFALWDTARNKMVNRLPVKK